MPSFMSQIAQTTRAALADSEAAARPLSLEGGTCRVSLTRTTPDGTVIYYYALFWSGGDDVSPSLPP